MDPNRGIELGDPSFTAFIRATDVNHEVIFVDGSVFSPDGSAVFIGVRDNGLTFPPVQGIEIHINDSLGFTWNFALDPVVQGMPGPGPGGGAQPVPEPSSFALCLVLGVTGAVARFKRRRAERRLESV